MAVTFINHLLSELPTDMTSLISPIPPSERGAACAALAEALIDDPFYLAVCAGYTADREALRNILGAYFSLAIDEAQACGEVHTAGANGAAIWLTKETSAQDREKHGAIRQESLSRLLRPHGFDNYLRISESMERQLPSHLSSAWYLSILGVRPDAQSQGLGGQLIRQTLARADKLGVTCFLETFNPLSLPFYHRLGFDKEIALVENVTSRRYWLLFRKSATKQENTIASPVLADLP